MKVFDPSSSDAICSLVYVTSAQQRSQRCKKRNPFCLHQFTNHVFIYAVLLFLHSRTCTGSTPEALPFKLLPLITLQDLPLYSMYVISIIAYSVLWLLTFPLRMFCNCSESSLTLAGGRKHYHRVMIAHDHRIYLFSLISTFL